MFTLMQNAVRYLSGSTDDSDPQSKKCDRPKLEDFISVSDFEREKFEGVVTTISETDVVINNDIYFRIPFGQSNSKYKVGDAVQGMAERKTKNEAWRAESMSLCPPQEEGWDASQPKLSDKAISCKDLDAGIPRTLVLKNDKFPTDASVNSPTEQSVIHPKESCEVETPGLLKNDVLSTSGSTTPSSVELPVPFTSPQESCEVEMMPMKTIIGKVTGLFANTVTLDDKLYFVTSLVKSSFQLWLGDWVLCKLDNTPISDHQQEVEASKGFIRVTRVDPLRKKKIKGEVTALYSTHYIINNEIVCSIVLTNLKPLRLNDKVVVEIIESEQAHLCWRALSVSFDASAVLKEQTVNVINRLEVLEGKVKSPKFIKLFEDKNDVIVSGDLSFPQVFIGVPSAERMVLVKNTGNDERFLQRVYFVSDSQASPFNVLPGSLCSEHQVTPLSILPDKYIYVKITCTGTSPGYYKQLCIFNFGDFRIGRYVSTTIMDKRMVHLTPTVPYSPQKPSLYIQPNESRIVSGEKPFKAPAFLPISLPTYPIPQELLTAYDENWLLRMAPFLAEPSNPRNYYARYSALLHLEEIAMKLLLRKFTIMRTTFSRHGEFLTLTVPGLAESRPSLMIGDSLIASFPSVMGGVEYEGFIHEVHFSQVFIKFHPTFHEMYHGEDYSVRFNFNRTPLRRCHFAIRFAMEQLGSEVLFPTKLKFQLPQICYVDPETFSLYSKRKTKIDTQSRSSSCQESPSCSEECRCSHRRNRKESGSSPKIKVAREKLESGLGIKCKDRTSDDKLDDLSSMGRQDELEVTSCQRKTHLPGEKCDSTNINGKYYDEDESLDEDRAKWNSVRESSPAYGKLFLKRGSTVTPPRIPVVTRLFGIPSSGSSGNSSMCCSDDDSKSSIEYESESRAKKYCRAKRALSRVNGEMGAIEDVGDLFDLKEVVSENHDLLDPREARYSEESLTSKWPPMKRVGHDVWEIPSSDFCREKEEVQPDECDNSLLSKAPDTNNFSTNIQSNSLYCNGGNVGVDETPVWKGMAKEECNGLGASGNCAEVIEWNCVPGGKKLNQFTGYATHTIPSESKSSPLIKKPYYVPVLPIKSSLEKRLRNGQVPLLKWFNKNLNDEQKMAVRRILEGTTRPLPYIIYGPPGTGKTITLVEAILQIFTLVHHSRLLVVTPSNSAADLVTKRLVMFGVLTKSDLVRLNAYQRKEDSIPEEIRSYSHTGDQLSAHVRQRLIVATAGTSGLLYTLGLHNGHFTHVFVDEAGQLTEPQSLVALALVNKVSGQIVLAGDPQQLGPVVQSGLSRKFGLQESLLHRLCNSVLYQRENSNGCATWVYEPRLVTLLVKNYRSHPDIISVPSKLFYYDILTAHVNSEIRESLLGWSELPNLSCPLLFHGCIGENFQEGDSPSWFNPTEVYQVVKYSQSLLNFGVKPAHIGIITPYRKQVQKIRQYLPIFGVQEGITVGTVEDFQGQERPVIIISTVRSSEQLVEVDVQHSLGFVKCQKRFNVAITRAQSLLVVVGNPLLLCIDNCWMTFISYCISKGAYRGPDLQFDVDK